MDTDTARAILSEAAQGDYFDGSLPEDESELIALAEYYVEEAQNYVADNNPVDEHINAIINLSISAPVLSEVAVHNHDGTPPEQSTESETIKGIRAYIEDKAPNSRPIEETYPRRSSGGYSEADIRDYEGLPIPAPVEQEVSQEMPTDLTELGDKAVRKLHSAFNSYLGRARWKLAIASSNLANATHLRDEAYRVAYLKQVRGEEKMTQPQLEAAAKDSDEYRVWNEKVNDHSQEVTSLKALTEIYGSNVERLSREWTMRTEQYERER